MRNNKRRESASWAYRLLWLALAATYLAAPVAHLTDYAWNYDEGPQIQAAALARAGHPLYSEIVLNKPPLLTWLIQIAFRLGGTTLQAARLATLGTTLIGFVALGFVAEQWWGRWAGPAAMAVFLALPEVPVRAAVVMNDLPAMSATLVALAAITSFWRTARWPWLAVSAVAYAAVLGFHPFLFPALVLMALVLLARHPEGASPRGWATRWPDLARFGVIVAGMVFLGMLTVDRRGLTHWVLEYNTAPVVHESIDPDKTVWELISQYLRCHWTMVGLAVAGGSMLSLAPKRRLWVSVAVAWFLVVLATLSLWQVPRQHYLLFLAYPLVVTAGGGVVAAVRWIAGQRAAPSRVRWWQGGLAALILIGALLLAARRTTTALEWSDWSPEQRAARAFLRQEGTPGEFIISDDPFLAFAAGYLVPPSLTDTSFKRIKVGYLRVEDIVGEILEHESQLIVFGTGRFAAIPSLEQRMNTIASQRHDFDSIRVYRVDLPPPLQPLESSIGEAIHLRGYRLSQEGPLQTGETLTVTLYWKNTIPVERDLTVFVHLMDAAGHLVGQHDSPPLLGSYPTDCWIAGVTVPDPHPIALGADLPPGEYLLLAGMYHRPSLERSPAFLPDGSRWPDDRIRLTGLHLTAPGD